MCLNGEQGNNHSNMENLVEIREQCRPQIWQKFVKGIVIHTLMSIHTGIAIRASVLAPLDGV